MTIYLPEGVSLFRQAFDETCDRILRSEQDAVFYDLFLLLAAKLREHPLLKDYILELENKSENQRQEFNGVVLKTLEDSWERLWEYYPCLKQRRKLVSIKQMITDSVNKVSCIPYREVRLMKDDQGNPYLWIDPILGNISREQDPKMYDRQLKWLLENGDNRDDPRRKGAYDLFSDHPSSQKSSSIYNRGLSCLSKFCCSENIGLDFFLPDTSQIEKFSIPGRNEDEKRKKMPALAETNPVFCWERIKILENISANRALPTLKQLTGRWAAIREQVWKAAFERCDAEILFFAKMSFNQKQSSEYESHLDCFLSFEYQINRKNYEKYLGSLKNHIHAQLFKIENIKQKAEKDPRLALPGTQKGSFVIDLASNYWKAHPMANRDEVFYDYCSKCPGSRLLSRERWEQIVRKRKLDPRPKEVKKRGPGKKTLQN